MVYEANMPVFEETHWRETYARPELMDGVMNTAEHVAYLQAVFRFEYVHIQSIIDFGFGLGHLFEAILEGFVPFRALGIEPSRHAYKLVKKRGIKPVDSMKLGLRNEKLLDWCKQQTPRSRTFDLGVCTSVFQYLEDDEIIEALPVMADKVKYLYFTVPTNIELDRQIMELGYYDPYAIRRTQERYLELLRPHFTVVSARVLESKVYFSRETTAFSDLLYRF